MPGVKIVNRRGRYYFVNILLQIKAILEKFPVWKEYRDQKHDLFLNDRPAAGYLTGSTKIMKLRWVKEIVGCCFKFIMAIERDSKFDDVDNELN